MRNIYSVLVVILLLLLTIPTAAKEIITVDEVKIIADETQNIIKNIKSYEFLLVKRELVNGRDTGHQYIRVKSQTEPFKVYVKYLKPVSLAGREALYVEGQDLIVKRGGRRNPNMTLYITPQSPMAMEGNRYPITHINPKIICEQLLKQIDKELRFSDTTITKYENVSVYGHNGTHYRLVHNTQEPGMECIMAELLISKKLGIPIYYKAMDWNGKVLEEYAFKDMKLNVNFDDNVFQINNTEYGFKCNEE